MGETIPAVLEQGQTNVMDHLDRLRAMLAEREADAAALRWAIGVLDGDPVSGSPIPTEEGTYP